MSRGRWTVRRNLLVSLGILSLVVVTCGGGGPGSVGDGDTTTSSVVSEEDSLAAFFGYGNEDPEEAQAQYREEESRVQELIRACMAEEGFDYTPVLPPEEAYEIWTPEDEEERIRTQGFGITTWYGNEEQFEEEGIEWEDPNQEMIEAMSETEQQAYFDALYGSEDEQMEGSVTEVDPETGEEYQVSEGWGFGCEGEAYEEIYGGQDQAQAQELWEDLGPEFEALYERVQADPRIVEFNEEWASCMSSAGFDFESREAMHETIFEDFDQRLQAIIGPEGGYVDPFEGWTEEEMEAFFEEHTDDEIDAFFRDAEREAMSQVDQEALAELQQEEIDLAVADFECGQGFEEVYTEVSAEYEAEFIAQNREILEQIREAEGG